MGKPSRIAACFDHLQATGRTGLITYLTAGYPSLEETPALVSAAIEGGASLVELGVPFSDPLADGATIQRASAQALEQGIGFADCFEITRQLRTQHPEVPLLWMGYYNVFLSYGLEAFCRDAVQVGLDGAIVVDLPPEEASPLLACSRPLGLDLIFLLTPTSTPERIKKVVAQAQGFLYCVSVTGITGARERLPADLPAFIAEVRRHTQLPLAVGFGISRPEHVVAVGRVAEAAVVGSALLEVIDRNRPEQRTAAVRSFVSELLGRSKA